MPCEHITKLYHVCETHHLKFSSSDLIRIICPECGLQETCPSLHVEIVDDAEATDSDDGQCSPVRES
jgi:hypothetical protein